MSRTQDAVNEKKELPFKHQHEISENMGEVEGLLQALFLDVDKAKKMQHPQANEISKEWVLRATTHQREGVECVNRLCLPL